MPELYKYQFLKARLLKNIQSGGYGPYGKIESEPALQRQFHLSRNTIRQAMKELEQEGYLYRIKGKGTFVKNITPENPKKIALIIYDSSYMTHHITGNIIRGIDQVLSRNGYTLDILAGKRDFYGERVDHLTSSYAGFLIGAYQIDGRILHGLIHSGKPCLFVKNYPDSFRELAIQVDYEKAGYLAAEHLIRSGCRDLGMINAPEMISISRDFVKGVRNAALEYGIRLKKSNCYECLFTTPEQAAEFAGYFRKNKVDGIVCASDEFAVALGKKMLSTGMKIPEKIQIIGCNNNPVLSGDFLPLTTIEIPVFELGVSAAEVLLERLSGIENTLPEKLMPVLIQRNTTKGDV